jgi:hypothetical protein
MSALKWTAWLALFVACASSCGGAPQPRASAPPAGPRTLRYRAVCQQRPCGSNIVAIAADGAQGVSFAAVNNGRGPTVRARLRLAPDGTLAELEITGTDTFGVALDERLVVQGGRARWRSHTGAGERALSGPGFYVPVSPLPALGMLAAAALRAGGHLALLPQGEARIEREADTTIRGRHLTVYAVTGLDFQPARVWLDDPWFSIVPEGWEDAIDPLVEIEKKLRAARERASAARLARRPPVAGLAFVHARVFDAEKKRWLEDHSVVVKGDRIEAVGPSAKVAVPAGAQVVDAAGKSLLPGLWDMHVHIGSVDGPLDIAAGVTTVRDMTNDPDTLADQARRIDEGLSVGPRVLRVGLVEGVGPSSLAGKFNIRTEEEGLKALAYYLRAGYVQFKFYNSTDPSLIPPLARAAHARGLRVSGHVPYRMLAADAVRAGYDEIQHINQVMLQFFADRKTDTRTLVRFTLPGERAAGLDLGSKPVRDFIELLRERRTVIDPTLVAFEGLYRALPGVMDPSIAAVADRLPPLVARNYLTGGLKAPGDKHALYERSFRAMLAFTRALHDAGVTIVAGTDGMAGFQLHRELELYVEAGIPAGDVLQLATLGAARVMRRDGRTGSVAAGKDADLVLVDGDPLARIGDVRRVVTVVKGGVVFDSAAVYATVGVRPWRR